MDAFHIRKTASATKLFFCRTWLRLQALGDWTFALCEFTFSAALLAWILAHVSRMELQPERGLRKVVILTILILH